MVQRVERDLCLEIFKYRNYTLILKNQQIFLIYEPHN